MKQILVHPKLQVVKFNKMIDLLYFLILPETVLSSSGISDMMKSIQAAVVNLETNSKNFTIYNIPNNPIQLQCKR